MLQFGQMIVDIIMMILFSMITTNHYHHHGPPIFMVPLRGAGWSTTTERDRDRGGQTQGDGKTHLTYFKINLLFYIQN